MDDQPQPLTMDRITDLLEEKDITYFFDQEGDVMTLWDNGRVYFRLSGEDNSAMQVLGMQSPLSPDVISPEDMVWFCNEWNRQRPFPKAYASFFGEESNREPALRGEQTFTYVAGVSPAQLEDDVMGSLALINRLFDKFTAEVKDEG